MLNFPTDDEARAIEGQVHSQSRFVGVSWHTQNRKWEAKIKHDGQNH